MKRLMWATTLSVAFVAAMSLGAQSAQEAQTLRGFGQSAQEGAAPAPMDFGSWASGQSVHRTGAIDGLAFDELGSGAGQGNHRPGAARMGGRTPLGAKKKE